jgi:sulfur carrier protein
MKVFIEKTGEHKEISFSGNGLELCKKLNVNLETVIILKNGNLITEDIVLEDNDTIELLSVISGG